MPVYCKGKGGICTVPCTNEACRHYDGTGAKCIPTVVDRLRSMTDLEWVDAIESYLPLLMEAGEKKIVESICDMLLATTPLTVDLAALNGKCTNSAAAGYIAALVGGNAVISRTGKLVICDFTKASFTVEVYEGGARAENEDFAITGVTFLREEVSVEYTSDGTSGERDADVSFVAGDGSLMVSNPVATQNAANLAFEHLGSFSFRPGSYTFPGHILMEPGDLFTVKTMDGTYTAAAVNVTMTIDGGVKTTASAGGAVKAGGSAGAINQALKALEADFARLRYNKSQSSADRTGDEERYWYRVEEPK